MGAIIEQPSLHSSMYKEEQESVDPESPPEDEVTGFGEEGTQYSVKDYTMAQRSSSNDSNQSY